MWCKGNCEVSQRPYAKPTELAIVNGVYMKAGTIDKPTTDEEVKNAEMKMDTYEQNKALCRHPHVLHLAMSLFKNQITQDT